MNKIQKTFPIEEGHYVVHARRKDTGNYEIIAPKIYKINKQFIFFKWHEYEQVEILTKENAVKLAKIAINTGLYQDVLILRDNGSDPEGYFGPYCPTVVFHNNSWTNYDVRYSSAVDAFNANKNATIIELKKKRRNKGFWSKCLIFISSFKKKKRTKRKNKKNDKK